MNRFRFEHSSAKVFMHSWILRLEGIEREMTFLNYYECWTSIGGLIDCKELRAQLMLYFMNDGRPLRVLPFMEEIRIEARSR